MHNLTEWRNREGELIGASVFLMADEVKEAHENGELKIELQP
jgi:hypothetical protein